jgi:hypothetical protein
LLPTPPNTECAGLAQESDVILATTGERPYITDDPFCNTTPENQAWLTTNGPDLQSGPSDTYCVSE